MSQFIQTVALGAGPTIRVQFGDSGYTLVVSARAATVLRCGVRIAYTPHVDSIACRLAQWLRDHSCPYDYADALFHLHGHRDFSVLFERNTITLVWQLGGRDQLYGVPICAPTDATDALEDLRLAVDAIRSQIAADREAAHGLA